MQFLNPCLSGCCPAACSRLEVRLSYNGEAGLSVTAGRGAGRSALPWSAAGRSTLLRALLGGVSHLSRSGWSVVFATIAMRETCASVSSAMHCVADNGQNERASTCSSRRACEAQTQVGDLVPRREQHQRKRRQRGWYLPLCPPRPWYRLWATVLWSSLEALAKKSWSCRYALLEK